MYQLFFFAATIQRPRLNGFPIPGSTLAYLSRRSISLISYGQPERSHDDSWSLRLVWQETVCFLRGFWNPLSERWNRLRTKCLSSSLLFPLLFNHNPSAGEGGRSSIPKRHFEFRKHIRSSLRVLQTATGAPSDTAACLK